MWLVNGMKSFASEKLAHDAVSRSRFHLGTYTVEERGGRFYPVFNQLADLSKVKIAPSLIPSILAGNTEALARNGFGVRS